METTHRPKNHRTAGKGGLGILAGIVVLAILFGIGLAPKLESQKKLDADTSAQMQELPEVELTSGRLIAADPLMIPANIEAVEDAAVQARASGYIRKVYVDIGSRVKAGQILADIESPDLDQQGLQAVAQTDQSQATVEQSKADVERLQAGVSQGRSDLIRQTAAIRQAQAAYDGTNAKLEVAIAGQEGAEAALAQADQAISAQKANLVQAQAQYNLAKTTEQRYRNLLAQGFVAQQDYDQTDATLKTAKANVDAVAANLASSRASYKAAEQAVRSAKALVNSARSDVASAKENISANKAMYESLKATLKASEASVASGYSTVKANQATVAANAANARKFSVLSGFEHVVAPFDGVITARNVDAGSLVNPGTATTNLTSSTPNVGLFGIARSDVLRIYVDLPQSEFQWAAPGKTAKVFVRELPGQKFEGKVYRTAGAINEATRTMQIEIHLDNKKGLILPGMYARVQISPPTDQKMLRVPSSVLSIDSKGTRVAVVDAQNHVHFKPIVLGRDYGTEAEVVSGIDPSDKLVNNPSDDLKDGAEVKIVAGAKG